ncbi:hypothetical protein NSP_42630 [Nodularia spumigena CCY9414]|nr:hypothetical protein NSP_42630 [Nodularia spumigena CCY9414]
MNQKREQEKRQGSREKRQGSREQGAGEKNFPLPSRGVEKYHSIKRAGIFALPHNNNIDN